MASRSFVFVNNEETDEWIITPMRMGKGARGRFNFQTTSTFSAPHFKRYIWVIEYSVF